jgi:hypothetical protein
MPVKPTSDISTPNFKAGLAKISLKQVAVMSSFVLKAIVLSTF